MYLNTCWFIRMSPEDFWMNPVKMLKAVDLPAPLGPNIPKICYFSTPKEIPFRAYGPLMYYFLSFFMEIAF